MKQILWIIGLILLSTYSLACTENWVQTTDFSPCNSESTADDYQTYTITWSDTNSCNTTNNLPYNNGTITRCNVPGWDLLMDGKPVAGAYQAMDEPWGGWLLTAIYIVVTFVIITKSDSWELSFIIGLIFGIMFYSWFETTAQKTVLLLFLIFQLGMVLYKIMSKEKNL